MEITEVRISLKGDDKLKAVANVTFDRSFVVRGLRIVDGKRGLFISMPSRRRRDGTYRDIAHPISSELREKLECAVIGAYEREVQKAAEGTLGYQGG